MGEFLTVTDTIEKADVIVVQGFRDVNLIRLKQAVKLWKQRRAEQILLVVYAPAAPEVRVIDEENLLTLALEELKKSGVPNRDIRHMTVYPGSPLTYREALSVVELLPELPASRLILVTEWSCMRRSYWAYRKAAEGSDIHVYYHPVPESFQPDDWWKDDRGLRTVVSEYLELFHYVANGVVSPWGTS